MTDSALEARQLDLVPRTFVVRRDSKQSWHLGNPLNEHFKVNSN